MHGKSLKVRLGAMPVDDAANDALIALLAEELAVPRRADWIVSGVSSRTKFVQVDGIDTDLVAQLAARIVRS